MHRHPCCNATFVAFREGRDRSTHAKLISECESGLGWGDRGVQLGVSWIGVKQSLRLRFGNAGDRAVHERHISAGMSGVVARHQPTTNQCQPFRASLSVSCSKSPVFTESILSV